ncbi:hypothetical protein [Hirschia litorea]|uniref:Uncharacterized protein n=1 Tax=Hirschia litorea TaxID=1199156 RepID=A0ABW2III8_9PROT
MSFSEIDGISAEKGDNIFSSSAFSGRVVNSVKGEWMAESENKLERLINLQNGWDGGTARSVSFRNANFAMNVLGAVCDKGSPAPQFVPGTNGDLQIEWHLVGGSIELHILKPNLVKAWYEVNNSDDEEGEQDLTNNFAIVSDWLKKILGAQGAADRNAA